MKWMLIQKARYKIKTRLSPGGVLEILRENTGNFGGLFGKKLFFGTVKGNFFRISLPVMGNGRNAWRPILHGTVRENPEGGSVVRVEAKLSPVMKGFGVFWMGCVGVVLIAGIFVSWKMLLTALFMLLFYFVLSNLAFHVDEKESRRRLTELLK